MEHGGIELDLICIKQYGFTYAFFDEISNPTYWNEAIEEREFQRCANGLMHTYSERYAKKDLILKETKPEILKGIDTLIEQMKKASKEGDRKKFKELATEVWGFRHSKRTF